MSTVINILMFLTVLGAIITLVTMLCDVYFIYVLHKRYRSRKGMNSAEKQRIGDMFCTFIILVAAFIVANLIKNIF